MKKLFKINILNKKDKYPIYVVATDYANAEEIFAKQYNKDSILSIELVNCTVL